MIYEPIADMTLWLTTYQLGTAYPESAHAEKSLIDLHYEGASVAPFLFRALRNPIPFTNYEWSREESLTALHRNCKRLLTWFVQRDLLTMEQLNEYRQLITAEKSCP